jgi:hypothetical protein
VKPLPLVGGIIYLFPLIFLTLSGFDSTVGRDDVRTNVIQPTGIVLSIDG